MLADRQTHTQTDRQTNWWQYSAPVPGWSNNMVHHTIFLRQLHLLLLWLMFQYVTFSASKWCHVRSLLYSDWKPSKTSAFTNSHKGISYSVLLYCHAWCSVSKYYCRVLSVTCDDRNILYIYIYIYIYIYTHTHTLSQKKFPPLKSL